MAEDIRGQVALVVSDGEAYTLRLTINGIIDLTDEFGEDALWKRWLNGVATLKEQRAILYQAMRESVKGLTLEGVGDIMGRLGTAGLRPKPWLLALVACFDAGGRAPKGRPAGRSSPGTGTRSSKTPSSPA
jgi:hypothetical protein